MEILKELIDKLTLKAVPDDVDACDFDDLTFDGPEVSFEPTLGKEDAE